MRTENVNRLLRFIMRRHEPDGQALSALLDKRMDAADKARLQAHIASCDLCRSRLAELRSMRDLLREAPVLEAPRSFRLRQADVEAAPRSVPAGGRSRWAPAVAVTAVVVFGIAIGVDVFSRGSNGGASRSNQSARAAAKSNATAGMVFNAAPADSSKQLQPPSAQPRVPANIESSGTEPTAAAGRQSVATPEAVATPAGASQAGVPPTAEAGPAETTGAPAISAFAPESPPAGVVPAAGPEGAEPPTSVSRSAAADSGNADAAASGASSAAGCGANCSQPGDLNSALATVVGELTAASIPARGASGSDQSTWVLRLIEAAAAAAALTAGATIVLRRIKAREVQP